MHCYGAGFCIGPTPQVRASGVRVSGPVVCTDFEAFWGLVIMAGICFFLRISTTRNFWARVQGNLWNCLCLLSTFQISEGGLQDPRASDTLYFVLVRSATFFRFGESWRQLKVYRMWARPQVINICMLYRPYDKNQVLRV